MEVKNKILLSILALVVLIGIFYFVTMGITNYTGRITGAVVYSPAEIENLAKCLASKGVKMYGRNDCGHCQNEKARFGEAWKYVNYVECNPLIDSEGYELCRANGINSVPTWIINDKLIAGDKTLEELAELAGCNIK
jgi:glutaredoxin